MRRLEFYFPKKLIFFSFSFFKPRTNFNSLLWTSGVSNIHQVAVETADWGQMNPSTVNDTELVSASRAQLTDSINPGQTGF